MDVLLIATGSEVSLAMEAKDLLAEEKINAGVVSFPSWELFDAQTVEYKDSVLPPTVRARVVVEAGISQGWHRYAGQWGTLVTLDRFGSSAPGDVVMKMLGFDAAPVVHAARESIARAKSI